ncbi:methionyl-tRNA synthetase [Pyricularia oryzae 70-15]|uniref:Probable methionine--tRNA ligase, mitochondrial n=3 Tax=Pyricularia oryzae TaxID=318829 RepID=G4MNG5_PYRO7|nr:methionyl-tRNA synthetase [Pyricularia oryzae 70-15]EHA57079.1 methionyl-tRNA synthetase [Pyricularia oryzae 70-15]
MERLTLPRIRKLSRLPSALTRATTLWTCSSCRHQANSGWRRMASTEAAKKPFYVTTPIFYVNASPHIGHLYTLVLADVFKRWRVLQGEKALLCTGTDEHGMKIQRAAAASNMTPKQLCDANSEVFLDLAEKAGIDNDFFIRTTDPDHKEAVQYFWDRLWDRGYIYEATHKGWYCVSDETFYPESTIEKRKDPMTGEVFLASKETGNAVEWMEEKTYHFRLTALKDRLLKFFEENPEWIVPAPRMKEVVDWVENSLEDLSVSRPTSRLDWGIRVPNDESQTIYVWIDALVNYVTKAGYPYWTPETVQKDGWPADIHIIGKDIVRFHCVYWPALLMALDLPLPRRILTHSHWTLGGKKMSKSLGNVVNPFLAMDRFGVEVIRYFLISNGRLLQDASYDNKILVDIYKRQLQGGVGNLLGRVMRSKKWNVREIVERCSKEGRPTNSNVEPKYSSFEQRLFQLPGTVVDAFGELDPGAALRSIADMATETNKFITDCAPWSVTNENDADAAELNVRSCIYLCAESLRIMGILLQPFVPNKSSELLDMLGVKETHRDLSHARLGADSTYGVPQVALGSSGVHSGLFPALVVEG